MKKLSALGIKNAGPGRLYDGEGLELRRSDSGGKWVYRYMFSGKRREMGLGAYPVVSLAAARQERDKWAFALAQGRDPITERKAEKAARVADMARHDPRLSELIDQVFEGRRATLRGDGSRGRWRSPLLKHVEPKIGRKLVSEITASDIEAVIKPIWRTKHPTARKAINRLHIVFNQGRLMGYQCDPFTIESAQHRLGEVMHRKTPIVATPWREIPELYQSLEGLGPVAACLQFMILTLVRSDGCRGARFDEIDGAIWTVPADRMKGREGHVQDFRVPLSEEARRIVANQESLGDTLLFTANGKRPVTDTALQKRLNEMNEPGRPHGFRTSFRTWVEETDACAWDVSETVLAHSFKGPVERAYARSDLLDRRAVVMDKWAAFVTGQSAEVVPLRR